MYVLHAVWSSQTGPMVWAEDSAARVKSPSYAYRSARPHPFALAAGPLAALLATSDVPLTSPATPSSDAAPTVPAAHTGRAVVPAAQADAVAATPAAHAGPTAQADAVAATPVAHTGRAAQAAAVAAGLAPGSLRDQASRSTAQTSEASGAAPGDAAEQRVPLFLPSWPSSPLDSPELVRTRPRRGSPNAPVLARWAVPAVAIDPTRLEEFIQAGLPDVRFGQSIYYLAALAEFAVDLAERGRVKPVLTPLDYPPPAKPTGRAGEGAATWRAHWVPVAAGHDLTVFQGMVAALPPIVRAEALTDRELDAVSPDDLVTQMIEALVDAAVRARAHQAGLRLKDTVPPRRSHSPGRLPATEAWLAALISPTGIFTATPKQMQPLRVALAAWDSVGAGPAGPAELVFRLVDPDMTEAIAVYQSGGEALGEPGPRGQDRGWYEPDEDDPDQDEPDWSDPDQDEPDWSDPDQDELDRFDPDQDEPDWSDPDNDELGEGERDEEAEAGGTASAAWRINFELRSQADPSLMVPAVQVWDGAAALRR
ncbi:MAG: hypothetical protein LBE08_03700, partial [Bifidobacteriaceae bacterium]|nr:hypothetical protein [Bifidobacteriaceae bacterium]